MYLDFFQFQKAPFHVTPDPSFLYASMGHREALSALIYGVLSRKGFITLTGEVGMGKTTILRAFLERIDREQTKVIYLLNPNISFDDLLKIVLQEFNVVLDAEYAFMGMDQLHRVLIDQFRQGRNVVLIIDEAQNMPIETLERLRVLSNLETSTDKLLQIIFCGQPEFDDKLDRSELRQLKQRIVVRATVMPFTETEGKLYIQHRLALAGAANREIFTSDAIRSIVKEARGIPRLINILCDNALVTAFGYQQRRVQRRVVREVIADRKPQTHPPVRRWRLAIGIVALVIVTGVFLSGTSDFDFLREAQRNLMEVRWFLLHRIFAVDLKTVQSASIKPRATLMEDYSTARVLSSTKESGQMDEAKILQLMPPAAESVVVERTTAQTTAIKPTAEKVSEPRWVTRIVQPGDRLIDLVEAVYGSRDERLVEQVQHYNLQIKNRHFIHVGDRLVFPPADHQKLGQWK